MKAFGNFRTASSRGVQGGASRVGVLRFSSPPSLPSPAPAALLHTCVLELRRSVRCSGRCHDGSRAHLPYGQGRDLEDFTAPHPQRRCVGYEALVLMVRWRSLALESGTEEGFMDDLQSVVRAAVENFLGLVHAAMDAVENFLEDLGRTLTCAPG